MKRIFSIILFVAIFFSSNAREGMWLPQLLGQLNEAEMHQLGLQISAEEIYSADKSSLKDAVLQFGGGCTGELISDRGLLITNHHCGFSQIQSFSTIENNYLKNGYWAMYDSTEIPCPGLTVTFIKEIIDVTPIVTRIPEGIEEEKRNSKIKEICDSIEHSYTEKKNTKALVRSFYGGNEFYLFISQVYRDIRFVGAPPESVGNFGGETDNWLWPRHTGDFSLFRIYADSLNNPSDYSKSNVPYSSKKFLKINIEGVKENDFTFVYGFPGRTNEYLTSSSMDLIYSQTNANKIKIREERLNIWRNDMNSNDTINLKYAAKFRSIANYYKKWRGENVGLKAFDVVEQKKNYEAKIITQSGLVARAIIDSISILNAKVKPISFNNDYYVDCLLGIELATLSQKFQRLITLAQNDTASVEIIKKEAAKVKADFRGFYKNYSSSTDLKICKAMLKTANQNLYTEYKPEFFSNLKTDAEFDKYSDEIFARSILIDSVRLVQYLDNFKKSKIKKLLNDEGYKFSLEINTISKKLTTQMSVVNTSLSKFQRQFIAILRSNDKTRKFFPDGNSTLRVTYGNINGMKPADGKMYNYFTTTDGILQKIDNSNPDFEFSAELEKIIRNKDFGSYAKNGSVPVAFISSNHTTNGNSGSPVLNSKGELIGINFDRVWEGNMSDYYFDENTCRNIAMDMHYFLFVVDKLGNANRLIEEMVIVR